MCECASRLCCLSVDYSFIHSFTLLLLLLFTHVFDQLTTLLLLALLSFCLLLVVIAVVAGVVLIADDNFVLFELLTADMRGAAIVRSPLPTIEERPPLLTRVRADVVGRNIVLSFTGSDDSCPIAPPRVAKL